MNFAVSSGEDMGKKYSKQGDTKETSIYLADVIITCYGLKELQRCILLVSRGTGAPFSHKCVFAFFQHGFHAKAQRVRRYFVYIFQNIYRNKSFAFIADSYGNQALISVDFLDFRGLCD